MAKLIHDISCLVIVDESGKEYKSGKEMSELAVYYNYSLIFNQKILFYGTEENVKKYISENKIPITEKFNAKGKTIMPGFVDSHTHIVFGGDRSLEFNERLRGATYKEIAESGGGIKTTVKATRNASRAELFEKSMAIAKSAMKHGTTSIEIKSGYGLDTITELKQLQVINDIDRSLPLKVSKTFMGAHDFPFEYAEHRDSYIELIVEEMLPLVKKQGFAEFCDIFVDEGYFTIEQGRTILNKAKSLGFKVKIHADELADVGAAGLGAEVGAISADHLLFISDENINKLRDAKTVATLLPGTAYFIRLPYAPARKLIDNNCIVALATDCNPGSCFSENMQTILSLAVINTNMTAEEAINAATLNGAYSLRKSKNVGSLEIGKDADFIVLDCPNYTHLFYHFGINHVEETWINGKRVQDN